MGRVSKGTFSRYPLSSWKAFLQSSSHTILFFEVTFFVDDTPLSSLRKGSDHSAPRDKNLLSAASRLLSFWMSLKVVGSFMSRIACIFSGLASIPLLVIMNPRNLPDPTPKTHF